jgi:anti-sigma regulatory factor (Ser/Thr protein kinase)
MDVFDKPLEERQIGGLGIHFVREMMNSVDYQRTDHKNIVTLTKNF